MGKTVERPTSDDEETKPTVEISALILQNEQQTEDSKKAEPTTAVSSAKATVTELAIEQTSKTASEAAESDSDAGRNSDSESKSNGHNSGLQTILVNLCEVIQQQLSPLLESVNLPAINIALATSNNGAISLNNIQQQLAVAQVATATQLQRVGPNTNPNQQRILNTASLLASQLSAAACAAAAVANSEGRRQHFLENYY